MELIQTLEKKFHDDPEHVCCSYECLYQKCSVTKVKLSDELGSHVWPRLKEHIMQHSPPNADDGVLYMCNYKAERQIAT